MSSFSKILVTTDLSDASLPALDVAAKLARSLAAPVTLLFVVEDNLPPILGFTTDVERHKVLEHQGRAAREQLEIPARQRLAGCEVEVTTRVGVPASEIRQYAQDNGIDLIVMASHGFGPMRQLLIGSTTERVLHHAPCPVLVVPVGKNKS